MPDIGVDIDGNFLRENGDLAILTGSEDVRQRVRIALLSIFKEWFRDRAHGVDWFGAILTRPFKRTIADREVRGALLAVEGVSSILSIDFDVDNANRKVAVTVKYRDIYQTDEEVTVNNP